MVLALESAYENRQTNLNEVIGSTPTIDGAFAALACLRQRGFQPP
jgi:hypothetical protein